MLAVSSKAIAIIHSSNNPRAWQQAKILMYIGQEKKILKLHNIFCKANMFQSLQFSSNIGAMQHYRFLQTEHRLTTYPAITFLGVYPNEVKMYIYTKLCP